MRIHGGFPKLIGIHLAKARNVESSGVSIQRVASQGADLAQLPAAFEHATGLRLCGRYGSGHGNTDIVKKIWRHVGPVVPNDRVEFVI